MNLVQIVVLACMVLDAHYAVTNAKQVCHTTFTAGAVIDRELYLFKNQLYWRFDAEYNGDLMTSGDGDPVTKLFGDALEGLYVKAIYQTTGRIVRVFTGKKYFDFSKNGDKWVTPGGKDISTDFVGINNPNAAVKICASGCTTFLINKKSYWEFDNDLKVVNKGSVQDRFGEGIPDKIDGAFKDGRDTMIIKGNTVFRIVGGTKLVAKNTEPKLLAAELFPHACEEELGK